MTPSLAWPRAVGSIAISEYFLTQLITRELNILTTGLFKVLALLFSPKGIVDCLKDLGQLPAVGEANWATRRRSDAPLRRSAQV